MSLCLLELRSTDDNERTPCRGFSIFAGSALDRDDPGGQGGALGAAGRLSCGFSDSSLVSDGFMRSMAHSGLAIV